MRVAKQVIVIRKDLNMRKGKIASQAAHASMGVLLHYLKDPQDAKDEFGEPIRKFEFRYKKGSAMEDWIEGIFTKICVSVNSEQELLDLRLKASSAGLAFQLIQDVGKTEFGGVPTYTALAIGPAWSEEIDPLTGHLPLL